MKKLLLFILISASKTLFACGFYPYGEDTRISLFNPRVFGYSSYAEFYYSWNSFASSGSDLKQFPTDYVEPNTKLWFDYCRKKVDIQAVSEAVYELDKNEMDMQSKNKMIQYLHQQNDSDALNYLHFAKSCEFFNSWQSDPWEKMDSIAILKRAAQMNKAIILAKKMKNNKIKIRYTFLAIRLAWYNRDYNIIDSLFTETFDQSYPKDILYYWSLYFKSFSEKDKALANFELAQVFANAVDKRFVCHQYYNKKIPIEQILKFAKTNEEKANVYLLAGIEKYDKALPYIQKMYEYNPTSDGLSFLLLREINKIEDFVFTPYYTLFQPSLSYDFWNSKGNPSIQQILKRSETDRIYAKEVLRFINKVDILKVDNPFLWQSSKAYLLFITRDYHSCLTLINQLEKSAPDQALNQIKIIKALALTAKQKRGEALIPTETQSTLIANKNNSQFIFAIGKELEYLGNSTDAALLYSKLANTFNKEEADANKIVFWKMKTKERKAYHTDEYFVDYFDYSDFVYTTEQTQNLIENIQKNKEHKDSFSVFKYEVLKDQIPKLYDLLGTKYIRQNKLENALATFEKSGNQYWNRAYTLWDDKLNIFDQNPFYNLKYTPQFITPIEKIRLNKYTVTKQLINYLQKAENPNEKNRDYYYFLVANAYYNMGREGNISMMRRLNGWSGYYLSNIEDEIEFRQSNLAKHYYLLAKQYAQTKKFEALCLRMVVRCEKHKIEYNIIEDRFSENDNVDSMISLNKYYLDLKKNYSDYFDDLVSNCDNFKAYFEARR